MKFSTLFVLICSSIIASGLSINLDYVKGFYDNLQQSILQISNTKDPIIEHDQLSEETNGNVIPLQQAFDNLNKLFDENASTSAYTEGLKHYTELSEEDIPIDISGYIDQYVLRFSWKDEAMKRMLIKTAHELKLKVWEVSVTKGFMDIQMSYDYSVTFLDIIHLKDTSKDLINRYDISMLIKDLPQAVLETYPRVFEVMNVSNEGEVEEIDTLTKLINTRENGKLTKEDFYGPDGKVDMAVVDLFFKQYRDLNTIYVWFDILVETFPDILEVEWIGQTFEGRDIKALRLSDHKNTPDSKSKTVVIAGGLHAREWISVSSTCFILYQLLSDFESGKKKAQLFLKDLDYLFLPVFNPDGYDYSWTTDRLWRKNRQETYDPKCFGIDIDHSFDFHFSKSEELPCEENYSGEGPFEAIESDVWNRYLNETKHDHPIYGYIDLHSYSEEILYPYAFSCTELPRDEENLLELAYGLSKSIRVQSGKNYGVLNACEDKGANLMPLLGSGSSLDYMYHNRAYWAFVIKLRDSGSHGFLLPSKYIVPVGKEIYSSIKYFSSFILGLNE